MYEAILSVRAGNIELDNIDEKKLNEETSYKIHDLRIIYDEFIERLSEKFATKDEMQLLLNEFLAKSNNLSTMEFYFSDFLHFSLQELTSVRLFSKKAKNFPPPFDGFPVPWGILIAERQNSRAEAASLHDFYSYLTTKRGGEAYGAPFGGQTHAESAGDVPVYRRENRPYGKLDRPALGPQ